MRKTQKNCALFIDSKLLYNLIAKETELRFSSHFIIITDGNET